MLSSFGSSSNTAPAGGDGAVNLWHPGGSGGGGNGGAATGGSFPGNIGSVFLLVVGDMMVVMEINWWNQVEEDGGGAGGMV